MTVPYRSRNVMGCSTGTSMLAASVVCKARCRRCTACRRCAAAGLLEPQHLDGRRRGQCCQGAGSHQQNRPRLLAVHPQRDGQPRRQENHLIAQRRSHAKRKAGSRYRVRAGPRQSSHEGRSPCSHSRQRDASRKRRRTRAGWPGRARRPRRTCARGGARRARAEERPATRRGPKSRPCPRSPSALTPTA